VHISLRNSDPVLEDWGGGLGAEETLGVEEGGVPRL
jgi:hypothetical protein